MTRVLLVEDDDSLGRTLRARLQRDALDVCWVRTAREAAVEIDRAGWALTILDVRLPDGDGFSLARRAKRRSDAPVMLLTALNSAANRLRGFQAGADEYLPKPFHLREFLFRVRHVLTTQRVPVRASVVRLPGLEIDLDALLVRRAAGPRVYLPARDGAVLKILIAAAPQPVARTAILDRLWGDQAYPSTRVVDNCVVRLRQALADRGGHLIQSIRGVGYRWAAEKQA